MKRLDSAIFGMTHVLQAIAGVAICLMMVNITLDVLTKYLFDQPIQGTLEVVSTYYMIAVVFMPIGYIQYRRGHVTVELFTRSISPRNLAWLDITVFVISIIYFGALFWTTLLMAIHQTQIREAWVVVNYDLPVWPARWLAPLGCFAVILVLVLQFTQDVVFLWTGKRSDGPGPDHPSQPSGA